MRGASEGELKSKEEDQRSDIVIGRKARDMGDDYMTDMDCLYFLNG